MNFESLAGQELTIEDVQRIGAHHAYEEDQYYLNYGFFLDTRESYEVGSWVAIHAQQLVAQGATEEEILEQLKTIPDINEDDLLVTKVPKQEEHEKQVEEARSKYRSIMP